VLAAVGDVRLMIGSILLSPTPASENLPRRASRSTSSSMGADHGLGDAVALVDRAGHVQSQLQDPA
jgi:hypothetical protein